MNNAAEIPEAPDDSTANDNEHRLRKRIWGSIDRWGPGVIAVVTLLAVAALAWTYSSRLARSEGAASALQHQVDEHAHAMLGYRIEVQTLQAYVAALRGDMIRAGMNPSPLPVPLPLTAPAGQKPGA